MLSWKLVEFARQYICMLCNYSSSYIASSSELHILFWYIPDPLEKADFILVANQLQPILTIQNCSTRLEYRLGKKEDNLDLVYCPLELRVYQITCSHWNSRSESNRIEASWMHNYNVPLLAPKSNLCKKSEVESGRRLSRLANTSKH